MKTDKKFTDHFTSEDEFIKYANDNGYQVIPDYQMPEWHRIPNESSISKAIRSMKNMQDIHSDDPLEDMRFYCNKCDAYVKDVAGEKRKIHLSCGASVSEEQILLQNNSNYPQTLESSIQLCRSKIPDLLEDTQFYLCLQVVCSAAESKLKNLPQ